MAPYKYRIYLYILMNQLAAIINPLNGRDVNQLHFAIQV